MTELSRSARIAFDEAREEMKSLSKALTDTKPITGELDPVDYKTAADVYRAAFDFMGLPKEDYEDVDDSAYATIFKYATRAGAASSVSLAGDAGLRRGASPFLKAAIGKRG
jgi:hypothetical protein